MAVQELWWRSQAGAIALGMVHGLVREQRLVVRFCWREILCLPISARLSEASPFVAQLNSTSLPWACVYCMRYVK